MIIYHHLGLGDHLVCNGLVRYFAEQTKVKVFCKYHNFVNVEFMYRDNANISVIPVSGDKEALVACGDCLRCGPAVGGRYYDNYLWDEMFYLDANIPFEYSWTKFNCYRDKDTETNTYNKLITSTPYAFIHNVGSDGHDCIDYSAIDNTLTIVKSDSSISLFDHCKILENAAEIHCINSSFIHLIDRLNINTNTKLFYHKNFKLKPFSDFKLTKPWIII